MINDFQKDHHYSIFDELPLIKNISYEMDSGKYLLLDNKGNNYICDIFGRQKPIFKKNISGFINAEQRKMLRRVKSHSNIINSNQTKNIPVATNKAKEETKSYFPSIKRFEGYAPFPRPLCPPFVNIPQYSINENYKKVLIKEYEKNLEVNENKKIFAKPNENKGLSFLTSDVKGYFDKEKEKEINNINNIDNKKKDDKLYIIKMIDNTVSDYKIRYKCDLKELINNHSIIRALLHLKKNLINNNETNIINGRKLKEPNANVINEYKIIHNKLFNFNEKEKIKNEHKRLIKCYSQMSLMNAKHNINNNDKNIYGRKILKKISLKKTPINTNTEQVISIIKNDYDNKGIKELFVDYNNINKNNESNFSISKQINENIKNQNVYDEQETKESIGTRANINLLNFRNNTSESNKEDNLSVISILNENEKNKFINFNKKIKYLKSLKKSSEKEKKNLEGFQKDEPKKPKEFNINEEEPPKYRDFGEIYKKELETLEKLNPILFNLQKKKDENDMKKMIKKKEFKKLNEKIIMKGKTLKIKKPPSD